MLTASKSPQVGGGGGGGGGGYIFFAFPPVFVSSVLGLIEPVDTRVPSAHCTTSSVTRHLAYGEDGSMVFFKALETRPNVAPSVPVVSAFLHNLSEHR